MAKVARATTSWFLDGGGAMLDMLCGRVGRAAHNTSMVHRGGGG
jgi:hypothetical protein